MSHPNLASTATSLNPAPSPHPSQGMIVAPQPLAVEAGAEVLQRGGNAIDAAIACALVQSVVSPQMCGIGGYLVATLHLADGTRHTLDAPATAGSLASAGMWQDRVIGPNPDGWGYFLENKCNDLGYQSVCTPGAVRGYAELLTRYGTLSWQEVLAPAIRLAEDGFVVDRHLATGWRRHATHAEGCSLLDYIEGNPEARRVYLKDGAPHDEGDLLRNPDYARTLAHLAQHGPDDFYTGDLAATMSRDLKKNGSFVTAQDLAGYRVRDDAALVGSYRDYTVVTTAAPHGGPTLLGILNILEGYDTDLEHNSPAYITRVAMAMKAAFADRNPHLGDPAFVTVPEWLTDKERAATWRERINAGAPITVGFTPPEPPDTTHVSVYDRYGNAASLTHSLGLSSGVITPGLGFMYNNSMTNFHPYPNHPNAIAAGKGRTTGMSPTIIYKGDEPVLIIGAPGATRIITGVVQVILNLLDFGMSISDAVLAPRFDCQGEHIRTHARIPERVLAEVRRTHPITRLPTSYGVLGLVHAIYRDPQGRLTGAADAGAEGMALVV